ncbi:MULTISPECIES: hypothetical protein [Burkholderia]|uniref:hypothetical protein n=1 Tax=Burkholderia TaxID=32008 RepID=UPI00214FF04A|nr:MULTISPECIES: hypothetical protein [Burkholderia]MDR5646294.1 hypothetical protein [Burkholderia cenocepacia]UVS97406.1 hypothetical protein EFP19_17740 [Burkholderia glumae]
MTTSRTKNTTRPAFAWLPAEARAALVAEVERTFDEAKATVAAYTNQPDLDDEPQQPAIDDDCMTDRDFRDCYGYPASWDDEVPKPRSNPDAAGLIEGMLRDAACSSDELDGGLFDHMRADGID